MILLKNRIGIFSNEPIIQRAEDDSNFVVRCMEAFASEGDGIVYIGFPLVHVGDICWNFKDRTFWMFADRRRYVGDGLDEGIFESPKWMTLGLCENRVDSELDGEYWTTRFFSLTAQLYQGYGKNNGLMNEVFVRDRNDSTQ